MSDQKDYYVKKVESPETNKDTKVASNVIFAVAGFALAGASFGLGEELFNGSYLQYVLAYSGVAITISNINIMRQKLAIKKANKKQYSKGKK